MGARKRRGLPQNQTLLEPFSHAAKTDQLRGSWYNFSKYWLLIRELSLMN